VQKKKFASRVLQSPWRRFPPLPPPKSETLRPAKKHA